MSDALQLILEDTDGTQLETSCTRFAVIWQGQEIWLATNLVSLELEMEAAGLDEDDDHVHGPDCNHD